MCDPISLLMGATTVLSAGMQLKQGQAEAAGLRYQARQAEADANAERGMGRVEAERIRRAAKLQNSAAVAAMAGSGIDVNTGTALEINRDIDRRAEEDAFFAVVGADDRALRLKAQAQGLRSQASATTSAARWGAFGTVLGGATRMYSGYSAGGSTAGKYGGGPVAKGGG